MSDQTSSSGGSTAGAFVLGGVVVALAVVAWAVFGGTIEADKPDVSIEVPGVGVIEGEVEGN